MEKSNSFSAGAKEVESRDGRERERSRVNGIEVNRRTFSKTAGRARTFDRVIEMGN